MFFADGADRTGLRYICPRREAATATVRLRESQAVWRMELTVLSVYPWKI
jgi:hypothetical protein